MSDPAVEAAQRVFADMPGLAEPMEQPVFRALLNDVATSAAREVLKPIRAKHFPVNYINRQRCCVTCFDSSGDPHLWPCEVAPLIYTTEEPGL
ncbi:hypothetical protein FDG62_gp069 [Mycobacterium phage Nepal]|uniref:Uncharacterized protein n=1 Tax=Mycobacterium phage Nepal TaxID=2927981 RepID=I3WUC9_9CAUD|nr:hypothetical protein FDG62_gp069 [Mycobacterium phage Nepal]AFL46600.1 hypothetical protein NEPAL_69 [Mycobacterium phage Nepal]